MSLYPLPRPYSRSLLASALLMAFSVTAGLRLSAEDDTATWDEAFKKHHARNVAAYGENIVLILPGTERLNLGQPSAATLTIQDVHAIAQRCPAVIAVAPLVKGRGQVAFNGRNWTPAFSFGTTPPYLVVRDWVKLKEGQIFTEEDIRDAKAVCLLGQTVAKYLFEGASPLGHQIRINGNSFLVIGVLSEKGRNALNLDQDDVILMPWTTTGRLFDATTQGRLASIWAKAASSDKMPTAMREISEVLREQHHITQTRRDDFSILDLIKSREEVALRVHEFEQGRKKQSP
jgi:putative ABC transport system permease protein